MTSFIRPGWRVALTTTAPWSVALRLVAPWLVILCLALAACGSSQPEGHKSTPSHSAPAQPSTGPAAQAAVKAMWQTFFNGTVPIPRRLTLLQDSQKFAPFVRSEAKTALGALVLAASAKVSKVALTGPGRASVTFTILLGTKAIAKNLTGTAVYSGGRWLVADSSFCELARKAYGKKLHALPAACGT